MFTSGTYVSLKVLAVFMELVSALTVSTLGTTQCSQEVIETRISCNFGTSEHANYSKQSNGKVLLRIKFIFLGPNSPKLTKTQFLEDLQALTSSRCLIERKAILNHAGLIISLEVFFHLIMATPLQRLFLAALQAESI